MRPGRRAPADRPQGSRRPSAPGILGALLALLSLLLMPGGPAARAEGHPPPDPRSRLALPEVPPDPADPAPGAPPPQGASRVAIQLQAGWNALTFPLGSVQAARGFPRQLLCYTGGAYHPVDPQREPARLDPGLAWLTWADLPVTVEVFGAPDSGQAFSTPIQAGWNVVGCPSDGPLPVARISLTRAGGHTVSWLDAVQPAGARGGGWIERRGRFFSGVRLEGVDLDTPGLTLSPGRVLALFSWADGELHWNDSPQPAPRLDRIQPNPCHPGQVVELSGQGFGDPGRGTITVDGQPIRPERILSWSDRRIMAQVPPSARPGAAGRVSVLVDRIPSEALEVRVAPQPDPPPQPTPASPSQPQPPPPRPGPGRSLEALGQVTGQITDPSGTPLAGARIWLDQGEQTQADASGRFTLEGIPAGSYTLFASRPGYLQGQGPVRLEPGASPKIRILLSPSSGGPAPPPRSTLTLRAYACQEDGRRLYPGRIRAWEIGNPRRRWERTWWSDPGDPFVELPCPGTPLGSTVQVEIQWVDPEGSIRRGSWQPKIWKADQRESYERP